MAQATLKRPAPPAVKETRLFINNEWVEPAEGKYFDAINPATGEVIVKLAAATAPDVDKAVKAARRALESGPWSRMDAADRGKLLFKLADLIEANARELAALESLNAGKTIKDSVGDMEGVCSAGLSTTVLPQARAGPHFQASISSGKFHGMIWPTTPTGCRSV